MPGHDEQVERYETQVHELQTQVKFLEEEVGLLRRRLTNAPRQVTLLEEKLVETRDQLTRAMGQNQKLADALRGERQRIEALAEEVEKLSQPPASFGVYLGTNEDGSIDVFTGGRKMRVTPAPCACHQLGKTQQVFLRFLFLCPLHPLIQKPQMKLLLMPVKN